MVVRSIRRSTLSPLKVAKKNRQVTIVRRIVTTGRMDPATSPIPGELPNRPINPNRMTIVSVDGRTAVVKVIVVFKILFNLQLTNLVTPAVTGFGSVPVTVRILLNLASAT